MFYVFFNSLLEEFDKDKEKYKKLMKGPKMESYKSIMVFVTWFGCRGNYAQAG
ncbi:MAG: hypothetical protein HZA06_06430 [Nitrospirae bacterium]|nr:hypothetical protein [Nitrospirota bacterium]